MEEELRIKKRKQYEHDWYLKNRKKKLEQNRKYYYDHRISTQSKSEAQAGEKNSMYGRKRELSPNWKGGRAIDERGFVKIRLDNGKIAFEHRLIAEKALGRKLDRDEVIHHVNGNKADNRNSNLLICDRSYHAWLHTKMSDLYIKEHFNAR